MAPNVRQQDLDREPLLCDVCDNERLAPSEDEFARRIFHPYHNGATTFEYGEWLPYFAVSLAWRCLLKVEPNTAQQWPQHASSLAAAELAWRAFLLRERTALAPYRHNLFFTSLGAEGEIVPEGLSWYSMRACDMTPVFGRTLAATYISLPGMLFWTYVNPVPRGGWQRIWAYINPLRDRGWKRTRISSRGTIRAYRQDIRDDGFSGFYFDRVKIAMSVGLSAQQKKRIEESIRQNPERALRSRSLEVSLDEERIKKSKA